MAIISIRHFAVEAYCHSGSLKHRAIIRTYSPIIASTLNAITYSILFTSFVLQEKLVGRRAESRLQVPLFTTTRERMAPPIASATVLLAPGINFTCYRNVTGVVSRWV